MSGWHCDCRMYSELDENDDEILLPCCWCGDNDDDVPSREIICPNRDDPDRNDCPSEASS